jgi:hypothetical protein
MKKSNGEGTAARRILPGPFCRRRPLQLECVAKRASRCRHLLWFFSLDASVFLLPVPLWILRPSLEPQPAMKAGHSLAELAACINSVVLRPFYGALLYGALALQAHIC